MSPVSDINEKMVNAFASVFGELKSESDRGSVVLAMAWIEDELSRLLKSHCLPSLRENAKEDEIFGIGAPVGDFSAKVDLAYRLGLVRSSVRRCLHLCRRLRNDFAHLTSRLSFDTLNVRDRVFEIFKLQEEFLETLWKEVESTPEAEQLRKLANGRTGIQALHTTLGTRTLFHMTAASIVVGLVFAQSEVVPVSPLQEDG